MPLEIHHVPMFSDNYCWIIVQKATREAYVVDPGESRPVIHYLKDQNIRPIGLLITHSHRDHIGGIDDFLDSYPVPVLGPACDAIPQVSQVLREEDKVELWANVYAEVMETPGHLPEHLCFFINQTPNPLLFCGDILFSSGCGRNFVGTAEEFWGSMKKLASLPGTTQVFCAHEYTLANCRFAAFVEPDNPHTREKLRQVERLRDKNLITLPTTIGNERLTNPFMRCSEPSIKTMLSKHRNCRTNLESEVFAALREWKNIF